MLTDHWVIAQLLAQACMLLLLGKATASSISMIRYWNASSRGEQQLALERSSYLVAAIFRLVLGFQFIAFLLFLATVNIHLPGMLKGAMCATGVLDMNALGYPLLALKSLAVLFYGVFLALHHYDEREPGYVLTPYKFYWALPAVLLLALDFALTIAYFANLSPDIIATCCSVAFVGSGGGFFQGNAAGAVAIPLWGFGLSAGLLFMVWWRKWTYWLILVLTAVFIGFAIWSLQVFFVKYIYGLPSHRCLFDIFWGKYGYVGYVFFGSYYLLGFSAIAYASLAQVQHKLTVNSQRLKNRMKLIALIALAISVSIPVLYWALWAGEL